MILDLVPVVIGNWCRLSRSRLLAVEGLAAHGPRNSGQTRLLPSALLPFEGFGVQRNGFLVEGVDRGSPIGFALAWGLGFCLLGEDSAIKKAGLVTAVPITAVDQVVNGSD